MEKKKYVFLRIKEVSMIVNNRKSLVLLPFLALFALCSVSCEQAAKGPSVTLNYTGPKYPTWKVIYAAWIEDENGANLQNLYVCKREVAQDLTGVPLPYWYTLKRPQRPELDAVSGPSTQGSKTVSRKLETGAVRKFRVCFEIDRSKNNNDWFTDRPSFVYKTALINLDSLQASYDLKLEGWMSNDTTGTYGQNPQVAIPGWKPYLYMTDLRYIAATGTANDLSDLVTALNATVTIPK